MAKRVLAILAPGFEETELVSPVDMLRRAGIRVTLASPESGPVKASREVLIVTETSLREALDEHAQDPFDGIMLPGGMDNVNTLLETPEVVDLLARAFAEGKLIGAICAAPLVLEKAGILQKIDIFTSHPGCADSFTPELKERYSLERVVVSKNVVTSRAPGTAVEFGLALVTWLKGEKIAQTVNKGVLAPFTR